MKRLMLCAIVLLLGAGVVAQSKPAGDVAAAVQAMEDKWTEAARKNDVAAIDGLLAANVAVTNATGEMRTKAVFLSELRARKYESVRVADTKVTVFGDTAIATGFWGAKGTSNGKPFEENERYTDTWVKINGQWKCVATHSSPTKATK